MTEPIFYDSYGTPVVAGDSVLIEKHYSYQHIEGQIAIVSWDSEKGMYLYQVQLKIGYNIPTNFHGVHSFKKLENGK